MPDDDLLSELGAALTADQLPDPDPARIARIRAAASARASARPGTPTDPSSGGPQRRLAARASARRLLVAAMVLVALGVGVVVGSVLSDGGGDDPSGTVEYAGPISGVGGEGTLSVTATGIGRVVELDTTDLAILPTGEYYEVWFVGPGDAAGAPRRISAGTFHPDLDGRSEVRFAVAVDPARFPLVQITAEPGDGDPAPSAVVVLEADLSQ